MSTLNLIYEQSWRGELAIELPERLPLPGDPRPGLRPDGPFIKGDAGRLELMGQILVENADTSRWPTTISLFAQTTSLYVQSVRLLFIRSHDLIEDLLYEETGLPLPQDRLEISQAEYGHIKEMIRITTQSTTTPWN